MDKCTTCRIDLNINNAPVWGIFRTTKLYFCSIDCSHNCNICMNLYYKKGLVNNKEESPELLFIDEDNKNKVYSVKLNEKNNLSCQEIDDRINIIFKMLMVDNNPLGKIVSNIFNDNISQIKVYINDIIINDIINNSYYFTTKPRYDIIKK